MFKTSTRIEPYELIIKSLSPFPKIVNAQHKNRTLENNHFSIALLLEVADINLVFSSDIEDRTIIQMRDEVELPLKFHYIKVPHHTSLGSAQFLTLLNAEYKSEFSCTTIYRKHNLPHRKLLNQYSEFSNHVLCTSSEIINEEHSEIDFGIICVDITQSAREGQKGKNVFGVRFTYNLKIT